MSGRGGRELVRTWLQSFNPGVHVRVTPGAFKKNTEKQKLVHLIKSKEKQTEKAESAWKFWRFVKEQAVYLREGFTGHSDLGAPHRSPSVMYPKGKRWATIVCSLNIWALQLDTINLRPSMGSADFHSILGSEGAEQHPCPRCSPTRHQEHPQCDHHKSP